MKANIECVDAERHVLGVVTVDCQWGQPVSVVLADLPADTVTIRVDAVTPNGVLAGGQR